MILEVKNMDVAYGPTQVIFDISLGVEKGEMVALLGRNGAGKTTTIRGIMGMNRPKASSIKFKGKEIAGLPTYLIARSGIGYVFQDKRIFPDLSVIENLEMVYIKGDGKLRQERLDGVFHVFPKLKELQDHMGTQLSGGEQRMLAIARALMAGAELVILDEAAEGLAPMVVQALIEQLRILNQTLGVTLLMTEQNVKFAMALCQRTYVLEGGRIAWQGAMDELKNNPQLLSRFLGVTT